MMGITMKPHCTFLLILVINVTLILVSGQESYEELCELCQNHKNSYRLSGWVCWTICGTQDKPMKAVKEQKNISKNVMGMSVKNKKNNSKDVDNNYFNQQMNNSWFLSSFLNDSYHGILVGQSAIVEVFKKARCIFPKDIDSITRALLLQQCFSRNQAQGNETVCYEELGCFPMEKPWVSLLRPFPTPHTPDQIDVKLYLYTRNQNKRFTVPLWPKISLEESDFDQRRKKTVFITHGFASNGNSTWLENLKDAYLKTDDANVFLVDWGKGASLFNYLQVASNTRIVGAELGRFGKYLIGIGVDPTSLHLIGHSLGSHISSYMAKHLADNGKPGRITALDPAQPGFEIESTQVRLTKEDAEFIDVLHTDAKPFIPFVGFGMLLPVGHVDFYVNDGTNQPGCISNINIGKIKTISDLADIPVEVVSQWVSCSHGRAYQIFTSALQSNQSCLWARKIPFVANFIKVTAMGALRFFDPLVENVELCTPDTCSTVGMSTPDLKARGIFTMSTTSSTPFCVTDEERDRKVKNILTLGLFSLGDRIRDGLDKLFQI